VQQVGTQVQQVGTQVQQVGTQVHTNSSATGRYSSAYELKNRLVRSAVEVHIGGLTHHWQANTLAPSILSRACMCTHVYLQVQV
jgi:hypothetical protein